MFPPNVLIIKVLYMHMIKKIENHTAGVNKFSVKVVNTFGLKGHTIQSLDSAATHLCLCRVKTAKDNK